MLHVQPQLTLEGVAQCRPQEPPGSVLEQGDDGDRPGDQAGPQSEAHEHTSGHQVS